MHTISHQSADPCLQVSGGIKIEGAVVGEEGLTSVPQPCQGEHDISCQLVFYNNCIVPLLTFVLHPLCVVQCSAHPVLCCSLSASRTLQVWLLGPVGGEGGLSKMT